MRSSAGSSSASFLASVRRDHCSPKNPYKDNLCLSKEQLREVGKYYGIEVGLDNKAREEMWSDIKAQMDPACNNDAVCLYTHPSSKVQKQLRDQLAKEFRPLQPKGWRKNPNAWLSTDEIDQNMRQLEEEWPDFLFLGPSPIDFDLRLRKNTCVSQELCELNLKKERARGKTKIGAIFNLDPHNKGGSHWVGLFINLSTNVLVYFDSFGRSPPKEVKEFIVRMQSQVPELRVMVNRQVFQKQNSQCGMYSIHFITMLVEGSDPEALLSQPLNQWTDAMMRDQRAAYFTPSPSSPSPSSSSSFSLQNSSRGGGGARIGKKGRGRRTICRRLKRSRKHRRH